MHGVMDQLEDKALLVRQLLRDMEEELSRKEARIKKITVSRNQMQREYKKYFQECEKLERDVSAAIEKDKDDIARMLIKKLKPLVAYRDELEEHVKSLDKEVEELRTCISEQRLQYDQLHVRSKEYARIMKQEEWKRTAAELAQPGLIQEPTEEEVELELLKRKGVMTGGDRP
jgi:phage shock protein A